MRDNSLTILLLATVEVLAWAGLIFAAVGGFFEATGWTTRMQVTQFLTVFLPIAFPAVAVVLFTRVGRTVVLMADDMAKVAAAAQRMADRPQ